MGFWKKLFGSQSGDSTSSPPSKASTPSEPICIIIIEADNLQEAEKELMTRVPEGFTILQKEILCYGRPVQYISIAKTKEEAFANAETRIPKNAIIIGKQVITDSKVEVHQSTIISVTAKSKARIEGIIGPKLTEKQIRRWKEISIQDMTNEEVFKALKEFGEQTGLTKRIKGMLAIGAAPRNTLSFYRRSYDFSRVTFHSEVDWDYRMKELHNGKCIFEDQSSNIVIERVGEPTTITILGKEEGELWDYNFPFGNLNIKILNNKVAEFKYAEKEEWEDRNNSVNIKANIILRAKDDGGISIKTLDILAHVFDTVGGSKSPHSYKGQIKFNDTEQICPGESQIVTVAFLPSQEMENYMLIGRKWLIYFFRYGVYYDNTLSESPIADGEVIEILSVGTM